jgi:hypothetical protein
MARGNRDPTAVDWKYPTGEQRSGTIAFVRIMQATSPVEGLAIAGVITAKPASPGLDGTMLASASVVLEP